MICEMDHATYVATASKFDNSVGALGFQPPEVFHRKKYSSKADVFCIGVILYQLLSGKLIY